MEHRSDPHRTTPITSLGCQPALKRLAHDAAPVHDGPELPRSSIPEAGYTTAPESLWSMATYSLVPREESIYLG